MGSLAIPAVLLAAGAVRGLRRGHGRPEAVRSAGRAGVRFLILPLLRAALPPAGAPARATARQKETVMAAAISDRSADLLTFVSFKGLPR